MKTEDRAHLWNKTAAITRKADTWVTQDIPAVMALLNYIYMWLEYKITFASMLKIIRIQELACYGSSNSGLIQEAQSQHSVQILNPNAPKYLQLEKSWSQRGGEKQQKHKLHLIEHSNSVNIMEFL